MEHAEIPLDEALRMASTYPAKVMKLSDRGKIEQGYKANLTIFSEELSTEIYRIEWEVVLELRM